MSAARPPERVDAPLPVVATPVMTAPQHRGWVGSILAALFIALASALLPGSMPASQMVGSAFNPATTQVALSRDENEQSALAALHDERERPPASGGGTDTLAVMALLAIVLVTARLRVTAPQPWLGAAPVRPAFALPGSGPRAPPTTA